MAKRIQDKKVSNLVVAVVILLVLIISVICVEIIIANFIDINNKRILLNENLNYVQKKEYTSVEVSDKPVFVKDLCTDKTCYLKVNYFEQMPLYYVIAQGNEGYVLNIYNDKDRLLSSRAIGSKDSLAGTYFIIYNNNVSIFSVINDGKYEYDACYIVNSSGNTDVFTSLGKDELQFTDNGIIYYYDACYQTEDENTNGQRIKALRMPFSKAPSIIDVANDNFTWCE